MQRPPIVFSLDAPPASILTVQPPNDETLGAAALYHYTWGKPPSALDAVLTSICRAIAALCHPTSHHGSWKKLTANVFEFKVDMPWSGMSLRTQGATRPSLHTDPKADSGACTAFALPYCAGLIGGGLEKTFGGPSGVQCNKSFWVGHHEWTPDFTCSSFDWSPKGPHEPDNINVQCAAALLVLRFLHRLPKESLQALL